MRQYEWMRIAMDEANTGLSNLDPQARGRNRIEREQENAAQILPERRNSNLNMMQSVDIRFALPNGILTKVDRASMFNSLEVRVPFLDTDILNYALGLPKRYTITPTNRKRILKHAFNEQLPPEIRNRGKQGFEVPIGEWLKKELADEFTTAIKDANSDILNTDIIWQIYKEHINGNRDHTNFLWAVYVFATWYSRMQERGIIN
jgi:asparagine synthase (glutamine-hydrolysing)